MSKKILFIVGTRPELIKVFPIINCLKDKGNTNYRLVSTGQHKSLLKKYWTLFDIKPDYELEIIHEGQDLSSLTAKAILEINKLLIKIKNEFWPDIIVSQGDTTTVMASSLVAYYNEISFAHVEAGLRSFNLKHPFPEEFNRRISSIVADYHFAPTRVSERNLLNEWISQGKIFVVGNTVIDTLNYFINSSKLENHQFVENKLSELNNDHCVLITCHRRENHLLINELIEAIESLAISEPNTSFIWPVHPNPNVYNAVLNSTLKTLENVIIVEPLDYLDLLKVLSMSKIVLTDSGGIQEEAPTFKVPVLVLRETTERPEAVELGLARLIEINKESIIKNYNSFLKEYPKTFENPYGDGESCGRIIEQIS